MKNDNVKLKIYKLRILARLIIFNLVNIALYYTPKFQS